MIKGFLIFGVLFSLKAQALVGLESLQSKLAETNPALLSLKQQTEAKETLYSSGWSGFYPISHDGKDLAAGDVKLTATSKLPKGKAVVLNLETKDGFYMAKVDFKDAYRIEVLVKADNKGKQSTFKFQVEK